MQLSKTKTAKLIDYFKTKPVKKVYLFGSYARGDANKKSDIDLILELDYESSLSIDLPEYRKELNALVSKQVDIYIHNRILKYARPHIWSERILIYRA